MNKLVSLVKKIKIKNLIILILLLAFNTYAWFIYASKVSMDLTVRVSSWNVEFLAGDGEIVTNVEIEVDRIYPGMDEFTHRIEVYNRGETAMELSYEIYKISIMGELYERDENTTSEDLEQMIRTNYPFILSITKNSDEAILENQQGFFEISVTWPFESGNDELDTFWGNEAYNYYALNPNGKCIDLKINLIATQKNE